MQVLTDLFESPIRPDTLLVLLPPAQAILADFHTHGFIAAVRERCIPVDITLAEVTHQQVLTHTSVAALHENVIRPALAHGQRNIWLAGISLGAFNALHYAAVHDHLIAGVKLISPYPGTGDVLSEICAAGGAAAWVQTQPALHPDERNWWHWLGQDGGSRQSKTPVYMSTGNSDRFLRGQRMIADLLPASRVHYATGTHDWTTWKDLWHTWLNDGPLSRMAFNHSKKT